METYITEDGHTKADCPECEASEHIQILEEHGVCEICQLEGRKTNTMKYKAFSKRFDDLEAEVQYALRQEIENSQIESETVSTPCIKVNVFDYTELVILHNDLTFIDSSGLQYSLYAECSLEDLVDILLKI